MNNSEMSLNSTVRSLIPDRARGWGSRLSRTKKPARRVSRAGLSPGVVVGVSGLAVLLIAAFIAPLPFDPLRPNPLEASQPPSSLHWLGTDADGFDVFSRTIAAASRDLPLVLAGTVLSLLVGVPLGLVVGVRGRTSALIMRGLDVFQAFPLVIIAIAVVTLAGNRLENVILAIAVINIPRFMRLIRSEALSLRESRFIEAATAIGASRTRILARHILPNVMGVTLAQASLAGAQAMIVLAALSFLGVGVSPPQPSWGLMIQTGAQQMVTGQWWIVLFPGLAVLFVVMCFNLIADGLQLRSEGGR